MTVSAPHLVAQRIFSTSSSMLEATALVADIGVDLHEEIAADDHRLAFRVIDVGGDDGAPARHFVAHEFRGDDGQGCGRRRTCRPSCRLGSQAEIPASRPRFSRMAMNSISGVMIPWRAYASWVTRNRFARAAARNGARVRRAVRLQNRTRTSPRARIQSRRTGGRPACTVTLSNAGSPHGPAQSYTRKADLGGLSPFNPGVGWRLNFAEGHAQPGEVLPDT